MNSPLDIFTAEELETLTPSSLKLMKQKMLLKFQLSNGATCTFNGNEIDKNTLLEIFEKLDDNLAEILFFHKDAGLKILAKDNGLKVFNSPEKLDYNYLAPSQRNMAYTKMSELVSTKLLSGIKSKSISLKDLMAITDYYSIKCPDFTHTAFGKLYVEIESYIDGLENDQRPLFAKEDKLVFNTDISNNVDVLFYNYLNVMPSMFDSLRSRYAKWCLHNVAEAAFDKERRVNKFPRPSLHVLKKSLSIASRELKVKEIEDNLNIVDKVLKSGSSTGDDGSKNSGCTILFGIFLLLKLIFIVNKCITEKNDYSLSKSNPTHTTYNTRPNPNLDKDVAKHEHYLNNKEVPKGHINLDGEVLTKKKAAKKINGESEKYINAILESNKKNSTGDIELVYLVDVLPSPELDFSALIPESIIKANQGNNLEIVFLFKLNKFRSIETQHRVKAYFQDGKAYPTYGEEPKSDKKNSSKLSTKSIARKDFNFKGIIQQIDLSNGSVFKEQIFSLRFDGEHYVAKQKGGENVTLDLNVFSGFGNKHSFTDVDEAYFYSALAKNIRKPLNQYLKRGNVYTLQKVFDFDIPENTTLPSNIDMRKGYVKYFQSSIEDSKKYVSLNTMRAAGQYTLDYNGHLIGMQYTVVDNPNTAFRVLAYKQ